jgi:hypothetical protein
VWPWTPRTVSRPVRLPRRPILIISPSRVGLVGSPTRQASSRSPRAFSHSSTGLVPLIATPSSSPVISRLMAPGGRPPADLRKRAAAATKLAMAPFMSAAPRP